jgi:putative membrane protein
VHVQRSKSWLRAVIVFRGSALQRIWPRLLLTVAVAAAVTVLDVNLGLFHVGLTTTPFALVGLALSIFLGFRNNTSYDRFWEGRKLWGRMVNVSRTLTRQILTLVSRKEDESVPARDRELTQRIIAYVHCLRMHLRDQPDHSELAGLLPEDELAALDSEWNRPNYLLQRLGDRFRELYDEGKIHAMHLAQLDDSLTEMTGVQGACERIKSTPIPFAYNVLIHRIVAMYCFALPFGLIQSTGMLTPLVVLFIAYAFFGLDAVGEQIEDPFGLDPNDLPLSHLCITIERNLRQRLGDTEIPALPTGDVLT